MTNEQKLWRAVVAQAFQDMIYPMSNRPNRKLKIQAAAKEWLTKPSEDLRDVCEYADMDPECVMNAARDFLIYGRSPTHILSDLPALT